MYEKDDVMATGELRVQVPAEMLGALDIIGERYGLNRTQLVNRWLSEEVDKEFAAAKRLVSLMGAPGHAKRMADGGSSVIPSALEEGRS